MIENLELNNARLRREALIRLILYRLRGTIQLRGMTPEVDVERVRPDFTDESARIVAVLAEAVEVLEAIIFASDGCRGHKECVHSMEPWQRARALLQGKWEYDTRERDQWP